MLESLLNLLQMAVRKKRHINPKLTPKSSTHDPHCSAVFLLCCKLGQIYLMILFQAIEVKVPFFITSQKYDDSKLPKIEKEPEEDTWSFL